MNKLDFVKKTIIEKTIVRDELVNYDATQQYYKDLTEALQIKDFPLIYVNTIEKKTYMIQLSGGQCYLVFDRYLLDCMHLLNQFVLGEDKTKQLESFFYKTISEECYTCNRILTALKFAGTYMENIDDVIQEYMDERFAEEIPEYLFVQQAFLIAHELFHFYLHRNSESHDESLSSKARYLNNIYEDINNKRTEVADFIDKAIKSHKMVEECLCDSTALIQAIDVGVKVGKLDIVESGVSAALALMNQYVISTIQDAVKHSGDIQYERLQNLFNFRVLHIKAFTEQYIKELYSEEEAQSYKEKVEAIHSMWLNRVYTPIMYLLVDINSILKKSKVNDLEIHQDKEAKSVLKRVYDT